MFLRRAGGGEHADCRARQRHDHEPMVLHIHTVVLPAFCDDPPFKR